MGDASAPGPKAASSLPSPYTRCHPQDPARPPPTLPNCRLACQLRRASRPAQPPGKPFNRCSRASLLGPEGIPCVVTETLGPHLRKLSISGGHRRTLAGRASAWLARLSLRHRAHLPPAHTPKPRESQGLAARLGREKPGQVRSPKEGGAHPTPPLPPGPLGVEAAAQRSHTAYNAVQAASGPQFPHRHSRSHGPRPLPLRPVDIGQGLRGQCPTSCPLLLRRWAEPARPRPVGVLQPLSVGPQEAVRGQMPQMLRTGKQGLGLHASQG